MQRLWAEYGKRGGVGKRQVKRGRVKKDSHRRNRPWQVFTFQLQERGRGRGKPRAPCAQPGAAAKGRQSCVGFCSDQGPDCWASSHGCTVLRDYQRAGGEPRALGCEEDGSTAALGPQPESRSRGGRRGSGRGDAGRGDAGRGDAGRAGAGRARGCRLRVHRCSLRGVSALCLEAGSAPTARVVLFSRPRPAPQQVGKQRRCGPRRSLPGRLDLVTWGRGRAAKSERSSCHGEGSRHPTPRATALRPATACPRVSGTQAIRTLSINPLLSWPDLDFYPPNDSPKAHLLCCHDARLAGRGRSVLGSSRAVKPAWDKGECAPGEGGG